MSMNCLAYELYWNTLSRNMNPIATQQAAIDNALIPPEKRLKIEKCNARIAFSKPQREETYQVTLEALKLSNSYPAFQIIAEVPKICMHQFWTTIKKIRDTDAYSFKLDKKKCRVDTKVFHEILQICPRILNQDFIAPPSEEELVTYIQELVYSNRCHMLSTIHTDQMHQPWRTFAAIIIRCISGKTTRLDRLRESQAQILWGMYNKKNVDYVALLWEDFMYQADNKEISLARKEHMPYPIFTKVIINHFISKDKTISMRNKINLHTIRDDSLLSTLKFVSKTQDYQQYGSLIHDDMINQDIKDSIPYKTYYDFATRKVPPKKARKYKKVASPSRKMSPVKEAEPAKKAKRVKRHAKKSTTAPTTGVAVRDTPGVYVSKKKAPAKADRSKGDGTDFELGVPDEQQQTSGIHEGTDDNDDNSDDDNKGDDDKAESDDDGNSDADDNERTDSDDDDENPSFTLKDYDEEENDEEYESNDDIENVYEEEDDLYKDVDVRLLGAEQDKERKVIEDAHVTLTSSQKTESSKQSSFVSSDFTSKFLILENVSLAVDEVASMMNVKILQEESSTQAPSLFTVSEIAIPETATTHTTTVSLTISMITPLPQLTTPSPAPTTVPTKTSTPALPDFSSLFRFDQRKDQEKRKLYIDVVKKSVKDIIKDEVKSLLPQIQPKEVSDFATPVIQSTINESLKNLFLAKSSSQHKSTYEAAESLTEFELKKILLDKIERNESYKTAPKHKELYEGLVKSYNLDKDLFSSYGKAYSLKRDHEDKDKDEDPFAGSDRGLKKQKMSKDAEPLKGSKSKESKISLSKGTKSQPKSSGKSVQAEEL
ncbi:hypothetical protein Tco_0899194, partial [Tanacetum coccineum]